MKLQNLPHLRKSMREQDITQTKFDFRFRSLLFLVVYIAEKFPHELLFGCRLKNLFFIVQVNVGYIISTNLETSTYKALVAALDLRFDPNNPFSPTIFFQDFDNNTPTTTNPKNIPKVSEIAQLRRDVEDSEKIYFFGWRVNEIKNSKVSPENLDKTRKICGMATYEFCKKNNISSCWTDDAAKEVPYYKPPEEIRK